MERPIFWHHGLFLQPQHFQLSDRYLQSLVAPVYRFLMPHLWGVRNLEIRKSALETRTLQITGGELVFRDMTHVVIPDNAKVDARSFDEDWTDGGRPLLVYLGIKRWNDRGENVTVLDGSKGISKATTRFVAPSDFEEVPDMHEQGPSAELKRLFYAVKIFWGTEQDLFADYEVIPVARLERRGDEIVVSERFIPPCIAVSASPVLEKTVREIRDQVTARGRQLELCKRDRGIHTAQFGTRDMVFLLALRSLNRSIPQLYHLTEQGDIHPWMLYGVLRQIIGDLSTFSEDVMVLGETSDGRGALPAYLHENLFECFVQARDMITRLLDEITAGPEYVFDLQYDGTYYSAELPPAIFDGSNRYYLVVETQDDQGKILESIETAAKLSSRESLAILIVRALPALGLRHLPVPPQELPRRANASYFQIEHNGDQWTGVQKGKNIALFWDSAPADLKVELMVVGRT